MPTQIETDDMPVVEAVAETTRAKSFDGALIFAVAALVDTDGRCPYTSSLVELQRETHMSERGVRRSLRRLLYAEEVVVGVDRQGMVILPAAVVDL